MKIIGLLFYTILLLAFIYSIIHPLLKKGKPSNDRTNQTPPSTKRPNVS